MENPAHLFKTQNVSVM